MEFSVWILLSVFYCIRNNKLCNHVIKKKFVSHITAVGVTGIKLTLCVLCSSLFLMLSSHSMIICSVHYNIHVPGIIHVHVMI